MMPCSILEAHIASVTTPFLVLQQLTLLVGSLQDRRSAGAGGSPEGVVHARHPSAANPGLPPATEGPIVPPAPQSQPSLPRLL